MLLCEHYAVFIIMSYILYALKAHWLFSYRVLKREGAGAERKSVLTLGSAVATVAD